MDEQIHQALIEQERKAWSALARYKFWMFGYHAGQWVMLNRLLDKRCANPFSGVVKLARTKLESAP